MQKIMTALPRSLKLESEENAKDVYNITECYCSDRGTYAALQTDGSVSCKKYLRAQPHRIIFVCRMKIYFDLMIGFLSWYLVQYVLS